MCSVCVASRLIDGEVFSTTDKNGRVRYDLKAISKNPETKGCLYSLRMNNGEWTEWFSSEEELADIVVKGGFDIKPQLKSKEQSDWLEQHFD